MRKKRFRIIIYKKGDISFYEAQVKSWLGWISFSVFYKTVIIHILSDPSNQKSLAYERIFQYCTIKGYKEKEIDITEITEGKNRMWTFS